MSDTFGHPSREKCAVCGKHKNNQIEPRFGYTVCEDHQATPPVEVHRCASCREQLWSGWCPYCAPGAGLNFELVKEEQP